MPKPLREQFLVQLVFVLALTPFLLGFIAADATTTVRTDGTGKLVIRAKIDPALHTILRQNNWLEQITSRRLPEGATLGTRSEKDGTSYELSVPLRAAKTGFKKTEHVFYANYHFNERVDLSYKRFLPRRTPQELKHDLSLLELKYEVRLPGKIISTNGAQVLGNRANWNLKLGERATVKAESQVVRWRLIIAAGTLALVIIGVLGAQIIKHSSS